jgi:hypothetical protein
MRIKIAGEEIFPTNTKAEKNRNIQRAFANRDHAAEEVIQPTLPLSQNGLEDKDTRSEILEKGDSEWNSSDASIDEKTFFQRVDSRPNLASRRSLLTTMLQGSDRGNAVVVLGSSYTPGVRATISPFPQSNSEDEEETLSKYQLHSQCPLCTMKMNSAEFKEHIANHLEQLALTSVNRDESPEGNDQKALGPQPWDDTMSEGRIKLETLNDFVGGQYGYLFPVDREIAEQEPNLSSNAVEQSLNEQELQDISTPANTNDGEDRDTNDGEDRDTILKEVTTPMVNDCWAQIRKEATERAARQSVEHGGSVDDDDRDTSGDESKLIPLVGGPVANII